VDGPTDWQGMLPNYWVSKDPRVPSLTLLRVMDDVIELVSCVANRADVIPGRKEDPDMYPVLSPIELGEAMIRAGRKLLSLTQPDSGLN
jgi:hypothetical protein